MSQEKLNELSTLNVSCFILWHLGIWTEKIIFQHVCLAGVIISLIVNAYFYWQLRRYNGEDKAQLYKRLINLSVFSLCLLGLVVVFGNEQFSLVKWLGV